jgi:hypothetical protein
MGQAVVSVGSPRFGFGGDLRLGILGPGKGGFGLRSGGSWAAKTGTFVREMASGNEHGTL